MAQTGRWVVLKATTPAWCTLQLPGVIAKMIEVKPQGGAPTNGIAFFNAGPDLVQVVSAGGRGQLRPCRRRRELLLATASLTRKGVFHLPEAVIRHIGLRTLERADPGPRKVDDIVAWVVAESEWERYLSERRGAPPSNRVVDVFHVYLLRSVFPGLLPSELQPHGTWPGVTPGGQGRSSRQGHPAAPLAERDLAARAPRGGAKAGRDLGPGRLAPCIGWRRSGVAPRPGYPRGLLAEPQGGSLRTPPRRSCAGGDTRVGLHPRPPVDDPPVLRPADQLRRAARRPSRGPSHSAETPARRRLPSAAAGSRPSIGLSFGASFGGLSRTTTAGLRPARGLDR